MYTFAILCAAYVLVGSYQLFALSHHSGSFDWRGISAVLSLIFVVLLWPFIVWEHTYMVCTGRSRIPFDR